MKFDINQYNIQPHPETSNWVYVYEPLNTNASQTAHPYCCYNSLVIFYENTQSLKEIDRTETHIRQSFRGNTVLQGHGFFLHLMSSRVIWYNNAWHMQHLAYKHTNHVLTQQYGKGYWVQGACIFIETSDRLVAANEYRNKITNGDIAIATHYPDAIARRTSNERLEAALQLLQCAEEALDEVWSLSNQQHWNKVGDALAKIKAMHRLG